ncbi:MAG: HAMP domain-containing protein [Saprospiraceae bacterium]|nr:HAMP domain-containing protein [Saprospiraceae bacterium]
MNLNFKDRIAFNYMIATALIMAVVFGAIYFVVHEKVVNNLDNDLSYEAKKHTGEIKIIGDSIIFKNKAEWEEREHTEIQVNPVFIQLIDKQGNLMDKAPNLKEDYLPFNASKFGGHFDARLNNRTIRQVQLPIEQNGKIKGYILAAMSSEAAQSVLLRLRNVLIVSFLIVLGCLYFISRLLAGRSIKPVQDVTKTISRITKNNLKERVALPANRDEIHELSSNFNALLERIENAIERERQFTSDASHELRTPLATLRGTLEVLIRKPRTQDEYESKIKYSLSEIERMTNTLEQLLLLARLDSQVAQKEINFSSLPSIIDESLTHFKSQIIAKNLTIQFVFDKNKAFLVRSYYTNLIVDNLLSNAIKYSNKNSTISISLNEQRNHVNFTIQDEGIGIKESDLNHIYENFYRSEALNHKDISGNGLGLSIVKKSADAIDAKVKIESTLDKGTTVTVIF